MIKVAIADDHALFREGIALLINSMTGIELSLSACDGHDLLDKLKSYPVDIVLLDLEMKILGGYETLIEIKKQFPSIKIIILSMHTEIKLISHLIHEGANSYLPKNVNLYELEFAIRQVYEMGYFINPLVAKSIVKKVKVTNEYGLLLKSISARELEVLELICNEFTSKEIADKLCVSERTVEGYRKHLQEKLGVKTTVGVVLKAMGLNLITDI